MNTKDWDKFLNLIEDPLQLVSRDDIMSARARHPLDMSYYNKTHSISITLPYVFKCGWCAEIGLKDVPKGLYQVIADTLGGSMFLRRRTNREDILNGPDEDILTLKEAKFTPEHSSSINQIKQGYVCDHCFECYNDKKAEQEADVSDICLQN